MLMAMEKIAFAESEHYAGPGWIGYNCDNIVDPDQAVVCNTIVQEQLVIKENGWEVWEFDDSLILVVIAITMLVNLYIQYEFSESNWCASEIDVLRLQIDEIHTKIVKD